MVAQGAIVHNCGHRIPHKEHLGGYNEYIWCQRGQYGAIRGPQVSIWGQRGYVWCIGGYRGPQGTMGGHWEPMVFRQCCASLYHNFQKEGGNAPIMMKIKRYFCNLLWNVFIKGAFWGINAQVSDFDPSKYIIHRYIQRFVEVLNILSL